MIHFNTVNIHLKSALITLMKSDVFQSFRLVGDTALSLQLGHRYSIDIDLFSDVNYGTIDFKEIDKFIEKTFPYHNHFSNINPALGKSYSIGINKDNFVKLDVYYTDPFIQLPLIKDNIRMASIEEIIAMKMDVVQRVGRKKDFWDLHELFSNYSLSDMISLHQMRYPYTHDEKLILKNLTNFELADNDFDPICLKGKYWAFIKEDIIEKVNSQF
jgi:predicted nucleotidyltransferase component of viral defense system